MNKERIPINVSEMIAYVDLQSSVHTLLNRCNRKENSRDCLHREILMIRNNASQTRIDVNEVQDKIRVSRDLRK